MPIKKCECQLCIAGLTDHERRITKLENKKKSKMPAWFQEWNEHVFESRMSKLEKDVQYLKENAVMKDEFEKFKNSLKPSAFKDSK
ncbi:hypothetical protein [Mycoplasmoides alvi]|uniref:hypothetical protein n=1 Tax=Mycoplasmoides alvi TaxID=78580 RepID=UPI00051BCB7E|nr:hypothetical protein [Mycoplasmoides alvi]